MHRKEIKRPKHKIKYLAVNTQYDKKTMAATHRKTKPSSGGIKKAGTFDTLIASGLH